MLASATMHASCGYIVSKFLSRCQSFGSSYSLRSFWLFRPLSLRPTMATILLAAVMACGVRASPEALTTAGWKSQMHNFL